MSKCEYCDEEATTTVTLRALETSIEPLYEVMACDIHAQKAARVVADLGRRLVRELKERVKVLDDYPMPTVRQIGVDQDTGEITGQGDRG